MMDTTTIRRTPVFLPVSCRFRAAVVKNSVAGFCSGEGPLATSMTHSTPVRAFTSPFLVITSTPREREIGTTLCPWALSTSTTCWPTRPVAPATATFMFVLFLADFSLSVMPDSRLQRFVRDSLYEWGPVVGPNRSTFHEAGRLMEAPASSRLVTGNADALAYFCKLCQTEMSLQERQSHNRRIHPDFFENQQRAYRRNMRIVITAVGGSCGGFLLGLFVPPTILRIDVPIWYVVAIFIGMVAGCLVPLPFVAKTRRTYFEDVGSIHTHTPNPSNDRKVAARSPYKTIPLGDIRAIQNELRKCLISSG